jgi:hypothetical protein
VDGYWNQFWKSEATGGEWQHLGVTAFRTTDRGVHMTYVDATYTSRDVTLPRRVDASKVEGGLELRLDLGSAAKEPGEEPKPIIADFRVKQTAANTMEGPVIVENKAVAEVRFQRLPDQAALRTELTNAVARAKVEQRDSRARCEVLRDAMKFWEKQIDEDRRAGRPTTGTPTSLRLLSMQTQLGFEETRVNQLDLKLTQLAALLVRLDASTDGSWPAETKPQTDPSATTPRNPLAK